VLAFLYVKVKSEVIYEEISFPPFFRKILISAFLLRLKANYLEKILHKICRLCMGTKILHTVPVAADHLQVTNIVTLFCDFMLIQFVQDVQLQFDV